MKLAFLSPLYVRQGPFASVYLDTSQDVENPRRAIELRWRHLRHRLEAQGVDLPTVDAVARAVGAIGPVVPGPQGEAIFATHGRAVLVERLPLPPARDSARFAMLPDAMPLAVQHAPDIPYVAAVVRRVPETGPRPSQQELEMHTQAGRWPTVRVAGGAPAVRRFPADQWPHDVVQAAAELAKLAADAAAETIVISGDAWARGVLAHNIPRHLRDRVNGVSTQGPVELAGPVLLEQELDYLFQRRLTVDDQAGVDGFLARRARGTGVAEGLMEVIAALRAGQAAALLINGTMDPSTRLWVGVAPRQLALSEEELRAYGVQPCWQEPADAALIRAVVGTRAELIVVRGVELSMTDGLGALLRYSSKAACSRSGIRGAT